MCVACGVSVPAVPVPVSAGFAERMMLMGQFSHAPTAVEARALARQGEAQASSESEPGTGTEEEEALPVEPQDSDTDGGLRP